MTVVVVKTHIFWHFRLDGEAVVVLDSGRTMALATHKLTARHYDLGLEFQNHRVLLLHYTQLFDQKFKIEALN